jgi:rod shape-determining protein MreC
MELRYMPANADVQVGDMLVTSGLDGIYLPGFPVAKVVNIERDSAYSFARIFCVPVAGVENFGEIMVLSPREARPPPPPESAGRGGDGGEKSGQRVKKKKVAKGN